MRSRDPEEVIRQGKAGSVRLPRDRINGYSHGRLRSDFKDYNLAMLLRDLEAKVPGLKRIRISSIEASQLTDEVIDVIDQSNIVVRHLHIPIQSGSDTVLKRMRRKYTMEFFADRLNR